jgi:flagellar export protein FliJ
MKGYGSLIRLKKWALDGLRQRIEAREADRRRLLDEADMVEQVHADQTPFGPGQYAAFLAAQRERQARLRSEAGEIETEIETLREELRDAFQDLKTMEKLEADRLLALAEAEQAEERATLDEMAIVRHGRE